MKPLLEVAHVLKAHWPEIECSSKINAWQLRTLGAVMRCRTAELGGHIDACTTCGNVRQSYNSCRNRHCPKCQGNKREAWIQSREEELLPVPYFHVVFTLPQELNSLALHQPALLYNALFDSAWKTIQTFGKDSKHLGAKMGMICILHTWGQSLSLHPHLHCIVPGGGITSANNWKTAKSKGKFLFPVKALSKVFRAKFVEGIKQDRSVTKELINKLFKKNWVVYAKRPFGNPQQVIEYLGRYTHKIAISNHRIANISGTEVTFSYKDYKQGAQKKEMTLEAMEFIRRFTMHILPKGFVRIRHFGILSSTSKKVTIPAIKTQITTQVVLVTSSHKATLYNPRLCPCCNTPTMVTIEIFSKRGPPGIKKINPIALAL